MLRRDRVYIQKTRYVYICMDIYMCVTCSIRSKAFNVLYEKMIACNICILNNCKNQMHAFADFLIQL